MVRLRMFTSRKGLEMAEVPAEAQVVVIGAGIVGNSLAYQLALHGWTDIVLFDKGSLPNPGGSTGHASNFIFPVDHSKEMTDLTADSVRQYQELGVFTRSGGIEVARTTERMDELQRRMASSTSWGIESELLSPAQIAELVPYVEQSVVLGGFHTPGVGVVDSLRAGTLMREKAAELASLVPFWKGDCRFRLLSLTYSTSACSVGLAMSDAKEILTLNLFFSLKASG